MSKMALPKKFELGNEIYTLAYFPGDVTQIEPNFKAMTPLRVGTTPVSIPAENGQPKEHFMTWCVAETPARPGVNVPALQFLLFHISDRPIDPKLCSMSIMIAYSITQKQQSVSMEQQFINAIIGVSDAAVAPKENDDWASKLFTAPEKENVEEEKPTPARQRTAPAKDEKAVNNE